MPDLGRKHVCFKCASKFYDLKKAKVICPKCRADQADAPASGAVVPARPAPAPKRVPKMVDPVEEEAPPEAEEAEGGESPELDVEGDEEMPKVEDDVDEGTGEDSYD